MRQAPIILTFAAMAWLAACSPSTPAPPAAAAAPNAPAPGAPVQPPSVANLGARPAQFAGADPTAYSQWLASAAISAVQQEFGTAACPGAAVSSLGVSPGDQQAAAPPGAATDITAIEHLQVAGCGRTDHINFIVYRQTAGGWATSRMLDGDSIASPQLQHDALQIAEGAYSAATQCPADGSLRLGAVSMAQRPNGQGSIWQEVWPATLCGKSVALQMTFTPDASGPGTSISATILRQGG
jgi:hypothetical protein